MIVVVSACLLLLLALRVIISLPLTNRLSSNVKSNKLNRVSTMVILGSGGHTNEIYRLLEQLNHDRYKPLVFVIAESDTTSYKFVSSQEQEWIRDAQFHYIPRSREVGQSWLSTVITSLYALVGSFRLVCRVMPDIIITNGPGTAVPLVVAAFVLKVIGVKWSRVVFVESFCRTQTLSLTAKIVYPFADKFVVHWEGLVHRYPRLRIEYLGKIL